MRNVFRGAQDDDTPDDPVRHLPIVATGGLVVDQAEGHDRFRYRIRVRWSVDSYSG